MILLPLLFLWTDPAWGARRLGPPRVEEIAAESSGLIRGQVVSATTREERREWVSTYIIRVDRVLAGSAPATVTATLPGGWYRGARVASVGFPVWKVGEEVLLFIGPAGSVVTDGVFSLHGERVEDPHQRTMAEIPATVSELTLRAAATLRAPTAGVKSGP
jgi:hypothetical protein